MPLDDRAIEQLLQKVAHLERIVEHLNRLDQSGGSGSTGGVTLSSAVPQVVTDSGSDGPGTESDASRSGHKHEGVHKIIAGTNVTIGSTGGDGTGDVTVNSSGGAALSDATPTEVGSSSSAGAGTEASRDTHQHKGVHGLTAGNTGLSMSAQYGDVAASRVVSIAAPLGTTAGGAAGTSAIGSNQDHQHPPGADGDPYTADEGIKIHTDGHIYARDYGEVISGTEYRAMTGPDWKSRGSDTTYNQEFDGANSIPAGWAWVNQGTATLDVNNNRQSTLELLIPSTATQAVRGIVEALPYTSTVGDLSWTFTARIALAGTPYAASNWTMFNSYNILAGVTVCTTTPGVMTVLWVGLHNTNSMGVSVYTYTTPTTGGAAKKVINTLPFFEYLTIQYDYNAGTPNNSTLTFHVGNGYNRFQFWSAGIVGAGATTLNFGSIADVAKIGIVGYNDGVASTSSLVYCDWLRKQTTQGGFPS